MKDRFIKIETAAEIIDVSIWTMRKWVKQRKIPIYKFGRAVRIKEKDLLKFGRVRPALNISEEKEHNAE